MFNKLISSLATVSTSLTNCGAPSSFKFVINEKVDVANSLFELHNGKPKHGSFPIGDMSRMDVSVFVFRKSSDSPLAVFAANAMRKLVSLRHPSILRVLDSAENENGVYIATEHVVPLTLAGRVKTVPLHGLYQLAKGIEFIHSEAKLVHGSIDPVNIFLTDNGGFRLGGFELSRPSFDSNYFYDKRNLATGTFKRIECRDVADVDTFGFVVVCHYLASGPSVPPGADGNVTLNALIDTVSRAADDGALRQLLSELARMRQVTSHMSCFSASETVQIFDFLESLHLHGDEAVRFLESLPARLARTDKQFQQGVLMDLLLTSVVSISNLVPAAIPVITAIASEMTPSDFQQKVQPKLCELFAIQDRSVRFRLLTGLPSVVSKFGVAVLEQSVLIESLSGFTDSHPSIRELTLRSVVEIARHVGASCVEKRVVPPLAKLLKDPESSIRTNAIVAIAKIAALIPDESTQTEIISVAVLAGLRDTVTSARLVALQTFQTFPLKSSQDVKELSEKFLPLVCPLMADTDAAVSNLAVDVMENALGSIRAFLPPKIVTPAEKSPEISFPVFSAPSASSVTRQQPVAFSPVVSQPVAFAPIVPHAQSFTPASVSKPNAFSPVVSHAVAMSVKPTALSQSKAHGGGIADLAVFARVPMMSSSKPKADNFDSFWDDIQSPSAKPSGNSLI